MVRVLRSEAHGSVVLNEADELGRVRSLALHRDDAGSSNRTLGPVVVESTPAPSDRNEPKRQMIKAYGSERFMWNGLITSNRTTFPELSNNSNERLILIFVRSPNLSRPASPPSSPSSCSCLCSEEFSHMPNQAVSSSCACSFWSCIWVGTGCEALLTATMLLKSHTPVAVIIWLMPRRISACRVVSASVYKFETEARPGGMGGKAEKVSKVKRLPL